jgi:hypothetical protein
MTHEQLRARLLRLRDENARVHGELNALIAELDVAPPPTSQTSQTRAPQSRPAPPARGPYRPRGPKGNPVGRQTWREQSPRPPVHRDDGLCPDCHDPVQACRCARRRSA